MQINCPTEANNEEIYTGGNDYYKFKDQSPHLKEKLNRTQIF